MFCYVFVELCCETVESDVYDGDLGATASLQGAIHRALPDTGSRRRPAESGEQ